MTNPIGPETCNLGVNMTRRERSLWGKAAFQSDASLNQFLQECALAKLREIQPSLALEIEKVRKARGMVIHLARTASLVLLAALLALAGSTARRGSRTVATSRLIFARRIEA